MPMFPDEKHALFRRLTTYPTIWDYQQPERPVDTVRLPDGRIVLVREGVTDAMLAERPHDADLLAFE